MANRKLAMERLQSRELFAADLWGNLGGAGYIDSGHDAESQQVIGNLGAGVQYGYLGSSVTLDAGNLGSTVTIDAAFSDYSCGW